MLTLHVTWSTFKTFLENCRRRANTPLWECGSGEELWRDQSGLSYLDGTEAELHQLRQNPERLKSMWQYWNSLHLTTFFYMKPDFFALCPPDILGRIEGSDWSWLLKRMPDKCQWEELNWAQVVKLPLGNDDLAQQIYDKWLDWKKIKVDGWIWLLGKNSIFVDKCDWGQFQGGDIVRLLIELPGFATKCEPYWDKLRKEDWKSLLCKRPCFAANCHCWEEFDRHELLDLLRKHSTFADKCDLRKLDGSDWVILLRENPGLADKCVWTKLEDYDWMNLLRVRPKFADKCDLAKLDGYIWVELLLAQPQFAENDIPWKILTGDNADEKHLRKLEQRGFWRNVFWKDEEHKDILLLVLECYPKVSLSFSWEDFSNDDCDSIWKKLKRDVLLQLLKAKPKLGKRIDKWWTSFTPDDLGELLCERPELADRCVLARLDLHNAAMFLKEWPDCYLRFEDIFLEKQNMPGTTEDHSVITNLRVHYHGEKPSTCTPNGITDNAIEGLLNQNGIRSPDKLLRGPDGRFVPIDP